MFALPNLVRHCERSEAIHFLKSQTIKQIFPLGIYAFYKFYLLCSRATFYFLFPFNSFYDRCMFFKITEFCNAVFFCKSFDERFVFLHSFNKV